MGHRRRSQRRSSTKGPSTFWRLKGNQGTLKEDVELYFEDAREHNFTTAAFDYHKSVDKGHGRIEVREYWVSSDIGWLEPRKEYKGLQSICMVSSTRIVGEQQSGERRLYISSLPPEAKRIAEAIRGHWGIENALHWVLDMAFREDECRKWKDNAAENFAILRHIALNLLKQEKTCKRSIAGNRLVTGWDNEYLRKVLFPS